MDLFTKSMAEPKRAVKSFSILTERKFIINTNDKIARLPPYKPQNAS